MDFDFRFYSTSRATAGKRRRRRSLEFHRGLIHSPAGSAARIRLTCDRKQKYHSRTKMLKSQVALVLTAAMTLQQLAFARQAAMLMPAGNVIVNSSIVSQSTAIFPDDQVQVGERSVATLTAIGSLMTVTSNSAFVFQGDGIQAGCGAFSVFTKSGLVVRAGDLEITPPPNQEARFKVVQGRGKVVVHLESGALSLVRGTSTKSLAIGSTTVEKTTACLNLGPAVPTAMGAIFGGSVTTALIGATVIPSPRPVSPTKP